MWRFGRGAETTRQKQRREGDAWIKTRKERGEERLKKRRAARDKSKERCLEKEIDEMRQERRRRKRRQEDSYNEKEETFVLVLRAPLSHSGENTLHALVPACAIHRLTPYSRLQLARREKLS